MPSPTQAAPAVPAPESVSFVSADSTSTIQALIWWPEDPATAANPRGVIQIVHGMAEHIRRYDEFARFLTGRGFVVCGDDHLGHGTSSEPESWGVLPAHDGDKVLVKDEHTLRGLMRDRVGSTCPHLFFGHSLGSYITRVYLADHGKGLAGAIICGTGTVPVSVSRAGNAMAHIICAVRGEAYRSKLLHNLGVGAYAKAIGDSGGDELAWLSHNKDNIARYRQDEACGFMFSAGGYATVTALTARACSAACAAAVPHEIPLLFVSGDGDPVGDMGKGVRAAAELALAAGQRDVEVKIFENMRHEILNERDHDRTFTYVAEWLDRVVPWDANNGGTTDEEGLL